MTLSAVAETTTTDLDEDGCPKSVLGKAHLILAAFGAGATRLGLTELSRRSGVPKASAYRLARELTQWGLLERVGDSYQLGMRVFELGQRVPVAAVLRSVARPVLVDLFATTRATIHLAVLDGVHVLYVEKLAGEANVLTHSEVGARLPATCTATGKTLLAFDPAGHAAMQRLEQHGLARLTSRSVAETRVVQQQLAQVRARGHAVELEETLTGHGSIAVPVTGADGTVYAAVSATTPVARLAAARLVPALTAAATAIARALDAKLLDQPVGAASFAPVRRPA